MSIQPYCIVPPWFGERQTKLGRVLGTYKNRVNDINKGDIVDQK